MPRLAPASLLVLGLVGCHGSAGNPACGIAVLAAPSLILDGFNQAGQTLANAPEQLPGSLAVRMAAGPVVRGIVGRTDSTWVIGVDGPLPAEPKPGFGVLALDERARRVGVLLYQGSPIPGAPRIGRIALGPKMLPLIGVRVDLRRVDDPSCPLFPDSLSR